MLISEVAMMSLALSLSMNPTENDVRTYHSLRPSDQMKIQKYVINKDALPFEIEKIKQQSMLDETDGSPHQPTKETTMHELDIRRESAE